MTSATISAVGQYLMIILPAFCTLRMKWYRTSICFDLCRLTGFLDKGIIPWLSAKIKTGPLTSPMSFIIYVRYIPSWTAAARAIYSASHDDRATVGCFLDFQEIREPALFKLKQYPLILHLSSVDDAQSASAYQCKTFITLSIAQFKIKGPL